MKISNRVILLRSDGIEDRSLMHSFKIGTFIGTVDVLLIEGVEYTVVRRLVDLTRREEGSVTEVFWVKLCG